MGMASSQVRLLAITNRMHDIEYKAQCLQNAKIRLSQDEDEAYQKYQDILDATTLTVKTKDGVIAGNFNNLMANGKELGIYTDFAFIDTYDKALVVPDDVYGIFSSNPNLSPEELALSAMKKGCTVGSYFEGEGKYASVVNGGYINGLYDEEGKGILNKMLDLLNKNSPNFKVYTVDEDTGNIVPIEGLSTTDEHDNESDITDASEALAALACKEKNPSNYDETKLIQAILQRHVQGSLDLSANELSLENLIQFNEPKVQAQWEKLCKELINFVIEENLSDIFGKGSQADQQKDEFKKYQTMFRMIKEYAGNNPDKVKPISHYNEESLENCAGGDSNWLQDQLMSGRFTVNQFTFNDATFEGEFKGTSVVTNTKLDYTPETSIDKAKLAKAEAEYEHTLKQIDRKDKQYDTELSKLESERKALDTERDGIKKVMEDNVDRTFGLFS